MARRRKGRSVNGWVILDKPAGMSSSQAVGAVKRILDAAKAGHGGTLDPLATGILPIALGEASKGLFACCSLARGAYSERWAQRVGHVSGELRCRKEQT